MHLADGLFLELGVTYGEDFIYDEDLGVEMRGNCDTEADGHAGRVALYRRIDIALAAGEVDDLIELARDLGLGHAHDRTVHVDVLAAHHFRMEAGADFEERGDAASGPDGAGGGRSDAREELQERRLAGTIAADDADHIALLNLEVDVLERPDAFARALARAIVGLSNLQVWIFTAKNFRLPKAIEVVANRPRRNEAEAVLLGNVIEFDSCHSFSHVEVEKVGGGGQWWFSLSVREKNDDNSAVHLHLFSPPSQG